MDYTRLRRLRMFNDLTLHDVQKMLNAEVSYSLLSKIENGYITEIKNLKKKAIIERCIKTLEQRLRRKPELMKP